MPSFEIWIERAHYDLDTAKVMLDSGRYLYVVFCCQQSVEKALKAVITKRTDDFPPRIHSLMRLAELAGLNLSEMQEMFFRNLSNYYIQSRYPEEIPKLAESITHEQAGHMYEETREAIEWLTSTL